MRIKNNQAQRDYFLLACVHGSAHTALVRGKILSQSILVPPHRHVELMQTSENDLSMYFSIKELEETLRHWIENLEVSDGSKPAEIEEGVHAWLMLETGGHVGVITSILSHLRKKYLSMNQPSLFQSNTKPQSIRRVQLSGGKGKLERFRDVMEHGSILRYEVRGIYTYEPAGVHLHPALAELGLSFDQFKEAVKKAIFLPGGIIPENNVDQKVYEVCHRLGLLFSQVDKNTGLESDELGQIEEESALKYLFPSTWHKRSVTDIFYFLSSKLIGLSRWLCNQLFRYTFQEPKYDSLLELLQEHYPCIQFVCPTKARPRTRFHMF